MTRSTTVMAAKSLSVLFMLTACDAQKAKNTNITDRISHVPSGVQVMG
jgi:hypothetical protein